MSGGMDFGSLMKMFGGAGKGQQQAAPTQMPTAGGKQSSIMGADNMNGQQKGMSMLSKANEGGSLINTNAKDAGGYTDASSSAMDGAQKGMAMGGPWGAAIGAAVGLVKGFQNRRTEHRTNQSRMEIAGRQQAADSYHAFDKVVGGLR